MAKPKCTSMLGQLLVCLHLFLAQTQAQNQSSGSDPYAPVYAECPDNLSVRPADGLSDEEQSWRDLHGESVLPALRSYLNLANISGLDVDDYMGRINGSNLPIVGLSVSGGGTQSGLGGLGVWQAFDARYPEAVSARTGGLSQILTYITGLSGGGAVTVGLLAANNFSTTDQVRSTANFSTSYANPTGNSTQFFNDIFENTGAKAESGLPISVTDPFGQFWGSWLPEDMVFANLSDLADAGGGGAFALGLGPMPIMTFAEVIPGQSPEIGRIMYPGFNDTNMFNLTSYEVNPYEFGSWAGGRVQAFFSTKYLGTNMTAGQPQNASVCVEGFDKLTFMQGTTTNAFDAWFIDAFYQIPLFARRDEDGAGSLRRRQQGQGQDEDDIPVPEDQRDNELVILVNQTAVNFNQTFNESMWATYPNPFQDYNDEMQGVDELLLIDGSLAGETNPIRPLIIPARQVDLVVVYEASSDAKYSWVNGTNLINSKKAADEGNIPFPEIPDVRTMVTQNLTRQPTLFGCNASALTPLVLYLPNSPWTGYSNFSYRQDAFTDGQVDDVLANAFQLATYGKGTVDPEWPACLACAAVKKSLERLQVALPAQCASCFQRHCWDGQESSEDISEADEDPVPRLNQSLTFAQWNSSVWEADSGSSGGGNGGNGSGNGGNGPGSQAGSDGLARPLGTGAFAVWLAVALMMFG